MSNRSKATERLNIQMADGQTIYMNRSLTHNLQQPAQETDSLSIVSSPGSQFAINQTGRKSGAVTSKKQKNKKTTTKH